MFMYARTKAFFQNSFANIGGHLNVIVGGKWAAKMIRIGEGREKTHSEWFVGNPSRDDRIKNE